MIFLTNSKTQRAGRIALHIGALLTPVMFNTHAGAQDAAQTPSLPKPAFAIKDDRLIDRTAPANCGGDIRLRLEGDTYNGTGKIYYGPRGGALLWCHGVLHTWTGRNTSVEDVIDIDSDRDTPLRFRVDREVGYVYVGGKGSVTYRGMTFRLPEDAGHLPEGAEKGKR